jgi:hypothetical protein
MGYDTADGDENQGSHSTRQVGEGRYTGEILVDPNRPM